MAKMLQRATLNATAGNVNVLEAYLAAPPLQHVTDPLAYWTSTVLRNVQEAPLARMALDYLSVPGQFSPPLLSNRLSLLTLSCLSPATSAEAE